MAELLSQTQKTPPPRVQSAADKTPLTIITITDTSRLNQALRALWVSRGKRIQCVSLDVGPDHVSLTGSRYHQGHTESASIRLCARVTGPAGCWVFRYGDLKKFIPKCGTLEIVCRSDSIQLRSTELDIELATETEPDLDWTEKHLSNRWARSPVVRLEESSTPQPSAALPNHLAVPADVFRSALAFTAVATDPSDEVRNLWRIFVEIDDAHDGQLLLTATDGRRLHQTAIPILVDEFPRTARRIFSLAPEFILRLFTLTNETIAIEVSDDRLNLRMSAGDIAYQCQFPERMGWCEWDAILRTAADHPHSITFDPDAWLLPTLALPCLGLIDAHEYSPYVLIEWSAHGPVRVRSHHPAAVITHPTYQRDEVIFQIVLNLNLLPSSLKALSGPVTMLYRDHDELLKFTHDSQTVILMPVIMSRLADCHFDDFYDASLSG